MGKPFQFLLLGLLALGLLGSGCLASDHETSAKAALRIVVPDDVKDRWQAVQISILDRSLNAETLHTVKIGEPYQIPGSPLGLRVETFLPSFIMNGGQMTSASNELRNPAAYVVFTENGQPLFSGWLFSLYPDAHAFHDDRYSFNLTGYLPAGKN